MPTKKPEHILRLPAVLARTGFSRSTLYRMVDQGSFPQKVQLSERCIGWRASEISAWERKRKAAKRRLAADAGQPIEPLQPRRRGQTG
jgi:prophage regulatory protein